jgi:hypothetical protein
MEAQVYRVPESTTLRLQDIDVGYGDLSVRDDYG